MSKSDNPAHLKLPPLRSLQTFEAFGRLRSVNAAARALEVTPGAVSQQLKVLEDFVGMSLILKDGRRAVLTDEAETYHALLSDGFTRLNVAQQYLEQRRSGTGLIISGLPTVLQKWLNPILHRFQPSDIGGAIRLESTHKEPDPELPGETFRITYGGVSQNFPHSRALFTDRYFPVCAPAFLEANPGARDPLQLMELPLIKIDWGAEYPTVPGWKDWLAAQGIAQEPPTPVEIHSLSGLALESAIRGKGVVLAQASFASIDLQLGRLVRLSDEELSMPEPYYVCWGQRMIEKQTSQEFLNWLIAEARGFGAI